MLGGTVNKIVNTQFKWSGMNEGMTGMQKFSLGATAVAGAVAAAGMALWRLADQTTKVFGAFEDMSQRTGIAASELHALSLAAEQTSSDFDAIVTGLRRMPSFLEDARNGMASATTTMDALGVSVADFEGLSPEDSFFRMVDALGTMEDETRRAALAQDVFGRGAMALIPLIEEGSGGLQDFAREARRTGMVLDDEAYAAADRFQDALARMQAQMQAALMEGIEPMLPELEEMARQVMGIAADAMPDLITIMGAAVPVINLMADALSRVVGGIEGIAWAWGQASEGMDWLVQFAGENAFPGATVTPNGTGNTSSVRLSPSQAAGLLAPGTQIGGITGTGVAGYANGLSPFREDVSGVQAEVDAARSSVEELSAAITTLGTVSGDAGGKMDDAEQARNDLIDHRMQLLEKQQNLEREQEQAAADALQAQLDAQAAAEQAEYDARIERLQNYADLTTQVMGAAWDSLFTDTRQSFGDMLKDMAADLAKSAVLGFLRKSIFGASTGGLGFFF